jgi:general secretion pathway protein G
MKIETPTTVKNELPIAGCRLPAGFQNGVTRRNSSIENRKSKIENAFTLVELMLVVTIIGILAALVIPKIAGRSEQARETAARADIFGGIKTALDAFEVDNGYYPKNLQDLIQQPSNAKNWHGPYLETLPIDPWNDPYVYYYPGKHNTTGYDLLSLGPDDKEGTDDDIGNWMK